jgi:pyridoxal phosphate enzyme (YggS family)
LEINIAGEESKAGFTEAEALEISGKMSNFPHCRLRGLMAIPPVSKKKRENCRFFSKILRLSVDIEAKKQHNIIMGILSMGMTDDFEDAIACGSTMIRIGTAIFGARDYDRK